MTSLMTSQKFLHRNQLHLFCYKLRDFQLIKAQILTTNFLKMYSFFQVKWHWSHAKNGLVRKAVLIYFTWSWSWVLIFAVLVFCYFMVMLHHSRNIHRRWYVYTCCNLCSNNVHRR